MVMQVTNVSPADLTKDVFKEGNLVVNDDGKVYLVTCVAQGYENSSPDTFWAIDLKTGISGGNYMKSLFKQFIGTVTLEGKL